MEKRSEKMKTNLFVCGFPKCGTTSLHKAFEQSDDFIVSKGTQEPHLFCRDIRKEKPSRFEDKPSDESEYDNLYPDKDEKYRVDVSPIYSRSKTAARQIKNYNQKAKILIMLREPYERAKSVFFHQKKYLEAEDSIDNVIERHKWEKYKIGKDYVSPLQRYVSCFEKSQILVLPLELLKENKKAFITQLNNFLETDSVRRIPKANQGKDVKNRKLLTLTRGLKKFIDKYDLKKYIPEETGKRIYKQMLNKSLKEIDEKPSIDVWDTEEVKQEVIELQNFLDQNDLLPDNIDVVRLWGYR